MNKIQKYEAVNKCKTLDELAEVIISFADEDGFIDGLTEKFIAKRMAKYCLEFSIDKHNLLTRNFGIRQQAIMLNYYKMIGI